MFYGCSCLIFQVKNKRPIVISMLCVVNFLLNMTFFYRVDNSMASDHHFHINKAGKFVDRANESGWIDSIVFFSPRFIYYIPQHYLYTSTIHADTINRVLCMIIQAFAFYNIAYITNPKIKPESSQVLFIIYSCISSWDVRILHHDQMCQQIVIYFLAKAIVSIQRGERYWSLFYVFMYGCLVDGNPVLCYPFFLWYVLRWNPERSTFWAFAYIPLYSWHSSHLSSTN